MICRPLWVHLYILHNHLKCSGVFLKSSTSTGSSRTNNRFPLFIVRYVGAIWFVFSNFYQLDSHKQNSSCISKCTMKHLQNLDWWKTDLPFFTYGYGKYMFVEFLTGYIIISPPNRVHYWVIYNNIMHIWQRRNPIFLKPTCVFSFMMSHFRSSSHTSPSRLFIYGSQLRTNGPLKKQPI